MPDTSILRTANHPHYKLSINNEIENGRSRKVCIVAMIHVQVYFISIQCRRSSIFMSNFS